MVKVMTRPTATPIYLTTTSSNRRDTNQNFYLSRTYGKVGVKSAYLSTEMFNGNMSIRIYSGSVDESYTSLFASPTTISEINSKILEWCVQVDEGINPNECFYFNDNNVLSYNPPSATGFTVVLSFSDGLASLLFESTSTPLTLDQSPFNGEYIDILCNQVISDIATSTNRSEQTAPMNILQRLYFHEDLKFHCDHPRDLVFNNNLLNISIVDCFGQPFKVNNLVPRLIMDLTAQE